MLDREFGGKRLQRDLNLLHILGNRLQMEFRLAEPAMVSDKGTQS